MNDKATDFALEPERLEALSVSSGAEGPGPAMEGAHQIARRTGAPRHDLLVVLGSGAADALASWGEPAASLRLSDLPEVGISEEGNIRSLHLGSDTIQSSMNLDHPAELVL